MVDMQLVSMHYQTEMTNLFLARNRKLVNMKDV